MISTSDISLHCAHCRNGPTTEVTVLIDEVVRQAEH